MKKILLTTTYVQNYTGSEISIYDLSKAFKDLGLEVIVGTFLYKEPLKNDFEKQDIKVYDLVKDKLPIKEYDLIWSQHYPTLEYVLLNKKVKAKKVIFSSLSHFEPLESPPTFIEDISLVVAHSEENKNYLIDKEVDQEKIRILPNSVTQDFFKRVKVKELNRLAVVSNHIPKEIKLAVEELERKGVEVDKYGKGNNEILIKPAILSRYDAVITIGRTVQYALALGIPVYCYDHFGGPGWITPRNINQAEGFNFSGRDTNRKLKGNEIVLEIENKFPEVLGDLDTLRNIAKERYNLNDNLKEVLDELKNMSDVNISHIRKKYPLLKNNSLVFTREFLARTSLEEERKNIIKNIHGLKERVEIQDDIIKDMEEQGNVVKELNDVIDSQRNHISALENRIEELRLKNRIGRIFSTVLPNKMNNYTEAFSIRINKSQTIIRNEGILAFLKTFSDFLFNKRYSQHKIFTNWIRGKERKWLKEAKKEGRRLKPTVKVSIVMPVYNIEPKFLAASIKSVKDQVYGNWELCIHDDASTNQETITYLQHIRKQKDERIKISFGKKNGHISHATNQALKLATGEFVLFMDNDDVLSPVALSEIVRTIGQNRDVDLIYYDEDLMTPEGRRIYPIFKPKYSPDTLLSIMYMAHSTYRRSLVEEVGGMRVGFEGSQDYDLALRVVEKAKDIVHIPHILYHWRQAPGSTAIQYDEKGYAHTSAVKALKDAIKRRKLEAKLEEGLTKVSFRVKYKIKNKPLISIIIPTKNHKEDVRKCIKSIKEKTDYKNYEIIIVDNNSDEKESLEYFEKLSKEYTVLKYPKKFNFAAINNFAVDQAKGDHVLLLNNDTEVITNDWLTSMLEFSQKDDVGVVGAMLLFPDDTFQHAGCVLGLGGVAGHIYVGHPKIQHGMLDRTLTIHNTSAVTGACLMVKKSIYKEVGGMDEKLEVAFNDIDFCISVRERGYKNIYTPFAQLYHYESKSRGYEDTAEKQLRFKKEIDYMETKWGDVLVNDPYYNPNLSLENCDFSLPS